MHEAAAILDSDKNDLYNQPKTIAYKCKSSYQLNRDKCRSNNFRRQNVYRNLRQTVENPRCDTQSSEIHSKTDLTPDPGYSSVLSVTAIPFRMSGATQSDSEHSSDQLCEASSRNIQSEFTPEI